MLNPQGQAIGTGLKEEARLMFRVDAGAAEGATPLDIDPVDPSAGQLEWTATDGRLVISSCENGTGSDQDDRRLSQFSRSPDVVPSGHNPWQHARNDVNVNGDRVVSGLDAVILINYLNSHIGDLLVSDHRPPSSPCYDVNGNGYNTAIDVPIVINDINARVARQSEGEGTWLAIPHWSDSSNASILVPLRWLGGPEVHDRLFQEEDLFRSTIGSRVGFVLESASRDGTKDKFDFRMLDLDLVLSDIVDDVARLGS
jgi:hypothetical protein